MATLWLHGFRSSPRSRKAVLMGDFHRRLGIPFECPKLPFEPLEVQAVIDRFMKAHEGEPIVVGGSSLGGFFAMGAARRYGVPAVLVNPAMRPWEFVSQNLGWHTVMGSDERFEVCSRHAQELRAVAPQPSDGRGWIVMLSTADQVLDWTEARDALCAARQVVVAGSDHEVWNFEEHMQPLAQFCADVAAGKEP